MTKKRLIGLAFLFLPLALTACDGVRDTLGIGRVAPDEFAVVDRPSLAIPPDFTLRPPQPGAPRPQEIDPNKRAEQTVFGVTSAQTENGKAVPTTLEADLLKQAGADKAESNIREQIDREATDRIVGNRRLIDGLLWWKKDDLPPAAVVDAREEAERLRQSKEEGAPPNQGATPIIEKRKSGFLGL